VQDVHDGIDAGILIECESRWRRRHKPPPRAHSWHTLNQVRNRSRTHTGQAPDRCRTNKQLSGLGDPKPTGLGMVSYSYFNLQMLQTVANCCKRFQFVARDGFGRSGQRACCKRFQSVAICYKLRNPACLSLGATRDGGRSYHATGYPTSARRGR
jgi:hypothetical protein